MTNLDGSCEVEWTTIDGDNLYASNEVICEDLTRPLLQGVHGHHTTQVHWLIVEVESPVGR